MIKKIILILFLSLLVTPFSAKAEDNCVCWFGSGDDQFCASIQTTTGTTCLPDCRAKSETDESTGLGFSYCIYTHIITTGSTTTLGCTYDPDHEEVYGECLDYLEEKSLAEESSDTKNCACYGSDETCQEVSAEDETDCDSRCQSQLRSTYSYYEFSDEYEEGTEISDNCSTQQEAAEAGATAGTGDVSFSDTETEFIYPHLNVNIPTVSFSEIAEDGGMIEVNFLAEYIVGIYKYLLAIGAIFAVVWIMIAGLQYVTSPGGGETGKAKEKITSALTGLVLLMSVYLLLFIVNPDLVFFESLELSIIPPINMEEEEETINGPAVSDGQVASALISIGSGGSNVIGNGREKKIPTSLISSINAAAKEVSDLGLNFYVTDAFRTYSEQAKIISEHCQNPLGSSSCNPRTGKSAACMLVGNNPENCPHTSGKAIDVWALGEIDGTSCITTVKDCLANLSACKANPCISAMKTAMANQGFCVLNSEPWHFEKPKKSSSCN